MESLKLFLEMDVSLDAIVPHKDAVLALAADRLADRAGMRYEHARDALVGREKLGSTALGHGVAMPHAMSRHCTRPAATLIGLAAPLDFDAPDDEDVDVVFALIWPQYRAPEFLKVSSAVSRALVDPAMLQMVHRSAAPDLVRRSFYFNAKAGRVREGNAAGDGGVILPTDRSSYPEEFQAIAPCPVRRAANGR